MRELKGQVRRYLRLVELGALEIDVTVLPPARRRALETLGRRMTAQQIRRLEPARRHPILLVLLHALVIERGDELLDLFDKLLRLTDGRARRRVQEQRRRTGRLRDELAALGQRLSVLLLECVETGELPFDRLRDEIGLERLQAAAAAGPAGAAGRCAAARPATRQLRSPARVDARCPRRRGAARREQRR
ncbi:MAG: hypothetical protein M3Y17_03855 [Actinomycetota bacterium]|nr:hypothetical protein [Actinomycetota bacterium]